MASLGCVARVASASLAKAAVLTERCNDRHVICGGAASRASIFNNIEAGARTHGRIPLLQLDEAATSAQKMAKFLSQRVVAEPCPGPSGAWAAMNVGTTTPAFPTHTATAYEA